MSIFDFDPDALPDDAETAKVKLELEALRTRHNEAAVEFARIRADGALAYEATIECVDEMPLLLLPIEAQITMKLRKVTSALRETEELGDVEPTVEIVSRTATVTVMVPAHYRPPYGGPRVATIVSGTERVIIPSWTTLAAQAMIACDLARQESVARAWDLQNQLAERRKQRDARLTSCASPRIVRTPAAGCRTEVPMLASGTKLKVNKGNVAMGLRANSTAHVESCEPHEHGARLVLLVGGAKRVVWVRYAKQLANGVFRAGDGSSSNAVELRVVPR